MRLRTLTAEDAADIAYGLCAAEPHYDHVGPCNRRSCFMVGHTYVINRSAVGPKAQAFFDGSLWRVVAARDKFGGMMVESAMNVADFVPQFDVYCFGSGHGDCGWAFVEMLTPIRPAGHRDTYDDILRRRVVVTAMMEDHTDPGTGLFDDLAFDCGYSGSDPRGTLKKLPFHVPYQWQLRAKMMQACMRIAS